MISVGNDKTVSQPYVAVDGKWCAVAKESVMVNGEWKPVFEKNTCRIRLYSYGQLVETLTCEKGSSVSLVSVPLVYGDDSSHVGWTQTYGATTYDYSATTKITPENDMDLHAVFNYYPERTDNTLDATNKITVQSFKINTPGPETIDIEGCVKKVKRSLDDDTIISTRYSSYQLLTDGEEPFVRRNGTKYFDCTLGNSSGPTVVSIATNRYDAFAVNGVSSITSVDTLENTSEEIIYVLLVHYRKYSGSLKKRSAKE